MNSNSLLVSMLEELGRVTDEPGRLTRTFLSPAMERAVKLVGSWMQDAGMSVRVDKVGNLVGRLEARAGKRKAKTLVLGSHLDTVRDAGKFDGALGVLLPIAAMHELSKRGVRLPYAVEIVGFSEEEGVRFGSAYLGSAGYAGRLDEKTLRLCDPAGVSVRAALEEFGGRFRKPRAAHRRGGLLGYVEVHIEQGPVLEAENLPVGVVSGIAGQTRVRIVFTGKAGHAGTTPMKLRRDALAGAAEFVVAVEAFARAHDPLVATVGTIQARPGAGNVIPGAVELSLDVRHARDRARLAALRLLRAEAEQIARARGLGLSWSATQDNGAVACSRKLTARLLRSVRAEQRRGLELVSGAGHDAVVMAALTEVAMLFVRCRGGLSHHPDEQASKADMGVALRVMVDFLTKLADNVKDEQSV